MAVLEKQYANAGLEIPSLENAWKTLMEPLESNPENTSTTFRETNSESEYIWDYWHDAVAKTRAHGSSQPESNSPVSKYKSPMEEDDAGEHWVFHRIIAEMIGKLGLFLNLKIASADLDFDHLDNIFADESFPYTLLRLNLALDRFATTESPLSYDFAWLGNISIPALFGDVGSNVDMSMSPPTVELEMYLQLRQPLQMVKYHVCREKNQLPIVEKDTDWEILRSSSEGVSAEDWRLWGRQQLNNWKLGAGRANSWKTGPSTKGLTKRKRAKCDRNNAAMRAVRYRCGLGNDEPGQSKVGQADLPVAAWRSCEARLAEAPDRRWRYTKILDVDAERTREKILPNRVSEDVEATTLAEDNMDCSILETGFSDTLSWLTKANEDRSQHCDSRTTATRSDSRNISSMFQFSGQLLCFPYRLMEHLRTEPHGEVYNIEDLDSGISYQAKVYILRGIDRNQRKRRVENLKRVTALPSFVHSFNYGGQKYCLLEHEKKKGGASAPKLGSIGRLNSLEYKIAFPPLPPLSHSGSVDSSLRQVGEKATSVSEMVTGQFSNLLRDPASDARTRQIIVEELGVPGDRRNIRAGSVPLLLRIMNRLSDEDRALVSAHANVCAVERRQLNGPETGTPSLLAGVEVVEVNNGQEPPQRKGKRRRSKRTVL